MIVINLFLILIVFNARPHVLMHQSTLIKMMIIDFYYHSGVRVSLVKWLPYTDLFSFLYDQHRELILKSSDNILSFKFLYN